MKRSALIGIAAAVTAAAIAGVLSRPYLWPSGATKHAHIMEQARAEPGAAIYYQDPDGKPFYSLTPKKTPDGRDYRAVPAGADVSFDDPADVAAAQPSDRKIKYYRNPMGLPDVSPMPKGALDKLTREEVLDLIAYVVSGANPKHKAFQGAHEHHGH